MWLWWWLLVWWCVKLKTGRGHKQEHSTRYNIEGKEGFTLNSQTASQRLVWSVSNHRRHVATHRRASDQVTTNGRHRQEGGGQVEKGRTHREAYEYKPEEETTNGAEKQQELTDFGLDVERHPISAQFIWSITENGGVRSDLNSNHALRADLRLCFRRCFDDLPQTHR